jgi:hypothetical protein
VTHRPVPEPAKDKTDTPGNDERGDTGPHGQRATTPNRPATALPALTYLAGALPADLSVILTGTSRPASLLGYLVAEIFGSLPRLVDDTDQPYRAHVRTVMLGMGFAPALVEAIDSGHHG